MLPKRPTSARYCKQVSLFTSIVLLFCIFWFLFATTNLHQTSPNKEEKTSLHSFHIESPSASNMRSINVSKIDFLGNKFLYPTYYNGHKLLRPGFFEKHVEHTVAMVLMYSLKEEVKTETAFFDVGGNSGWFTYNFASQGYTTYTFELLPPCQEIIETGILLNKLNDKVYLFGAGAGSGYSTFTMKPGPCRWGESYDVKKKEQGLTVYTLVLDDIMKTWDGSIVVKIDAEGSEIDILKGMKNSLAEGKIKNMVVEFLPRSWSMKGITQEEGIEVIEEIIGLGFKMILLHDYKKYGSYAKPVNIFPNLKTWDAADSVAEFVKDRYKYKGAGANVLFSKVFST